MTSWFRPDARPQTAPRRALRPRPPPRRGARAPQQRRGGQRLRHRRAVRRQRPHGDPLHPRAAGRGRAALRGGRGAAQGLAPDGQRPPADGDADDRPDGRAVSLPPRVRLPRRHRVQGGPRRALRQAGGAAAAQGLRVRPQPRPQGLRRERGPPPLRGAHRGRERHRHRAPARGAPAGHARERLGRQEDLRPRAVHPDGLQEGAVSGRAQRTGTPGRSARSRSTRSGRSSGCGGTRSSTRPTTGPSRSPRGRSG